MSRQDPGEKTAVSQPKEVSQPSKEGKKVSAQSTWPAQRKTEPQRKLGQNGKLGGAGALWFLQTESGQSSTQRSLCNPQEPRPGMVALV